MTGSAITEVVAAIMHLSTEVPSLRRAFKKDRFNLNFGV